MGTDPRIGFTQAIEHQADLRREVDRYRLAAYARRRQREQAQLRRARASPVARLAHALSVAFADLACTLGYDVDCRQDIA